MPRQYKNPVMARRQYELIAQAIANTRSRIELQFNDAQQVGEIEALDMLINELVVAFQQDNPNFKEPRFIKACNKAIGYKLI